MSSQPTADCLPACLRACWPDEGGRRALILPPAAPPRCHPAQCTCNADAHFEASGGGCQCKASEGWIADPQNLGTCLCDAGSGFIADGNGACTCNADKNFVADGAACKCADGYLLVGGTECVAVSACQSLVTGCATCDGANPRLCKECSTASGYASAPDANGKVRPCCQAWAAGRLGRWAWGSAPPDGACQ